MKRFKNKVSVVIPVYNAEKHIDRCLSSIVKQTYDNLEIIVVDDGSTDASPQICKSFSEADDRVTVVRQMNSGPSSARNNGLSLCTGDYLMFSDADDYLELDYIEQLSQPMNRYPFPEMSISGVTHEYYSPYSEKSVVFEEDRTWSVDEMPLFYPMQLQLLPVVANKMYRLSFIRDNCIVYDENLHYYEDFLFILDAIEKAKHVAFVASSGYRYCHNIGSLSYQPVQNRWKLDIESYNRYIEVSNKIGVYEKHQGEIELYLWRCIRSTIRSELRNRDMSFPENKRLINEICLDPQVQRSVRLMGKTDALSSLFLFLIRMRAISLVTILFSLERRTDEHLHSLMPIIKRLFRY